ncbi:DUF6746 family protein [Idiomarina piscisalsi]|uniref:Uncharacterized protein n=1 Tax=Idiomarina piscisalsi TaxID=1096243 RepID=A0A432YLW9_9GAMM|nr:DUF6746 family protein [Idiomarina piscisalsi]RUO61977.1 hypothetical protein CWI73_10925 [Idiomarina piscisalsi]
MKALTMILAGAALLFNVAAVADDDDQRYQHFKPEPSDNLHQAIMNLTKYNAKLQEIIEGDMPPKDMAKVHELTYTLEVALARLSKELDVAANSLEEVHLGSEAMNKQRVEGFGKSYLETLNHVLGKHAEHHENGHDEEHENHH